MIASKSINLFKGSHGYKDGEQRRDFTHVDDIVDGMERVMRAMNGEVDMFYHGAEFELGRGINYSINEWNYIIRSGAVLSIIWK